MRGLIENWTQLPPTRIHLRTTSASGPEVECARRACVQPGCGAQQGRPVHLPECGRRARRLSARAGRGRLAAAPARGRDAQAIHQAHQRIHHRLSTEAHL